MPVLNESEDIQTIIEVSASNEVKSDETMNDEISLEEFFEENFSTKEEAEKEKEEAEKKDDAIKKVDEIALADEAENARKELLEIITENKNDEELDIVEEAVVAEEILESTNDSELEEINENLADDFNEEEFLEELADTEDITSLPEEEQLQPMILDDMPEDNTDFGDEDLNDLLNRVDDLLNSYSN